MLLQWVSLINSQYRPPIQKTFGLVLVSLTDSWKAHLHSLKQRERWSNYWVCGWNPMAILFKQNLLSSTVHFFCLMLWNLSRFLSNFSHYIVLGVDGFRKLPGLVVQRPIISNPGLNFSTSFFFIVWSILNFSKWSLLDLLVFSKTLYPCTKNYGKKTQQ